MSREASGLSAWLLQRLSAVYMLGFIGYFLLALAFGEPLSYPSWRDWMGGAWMGLAVALFFAALLIHAWVGLRDVVMDYARAVGLRLALLSLIALALTACGLWVLRVLWQAGVT